jgi:FtsP/CotA-like multicopper oxidase with cupredoxin domain
MKPAEAKETHVMRALVKTKISTLLAMLVVACGLAMVSGVGSGAAATSAIDLCAVPGNATLTGSVTVPIWGFGKPATPGDCSTATASLPGPVLTVDEGDTVTITVTNALPAGHAVTLEAPGIDFDPGPTDASVGATVTRTFTASRPGTYLYQSGGDAGRQEAMGLYGALIVRPSTAGQAYDDASTAYDVEAPLVLGQVDPNFNAAPDTFNMNDYLATYWLINGKAYSETAPGPGIKATAGQRVLLRYLNAGDDNTSMSLLGMHQRVLARDANLLNNPFSAVAETLPAGGTEDAIATVPSFAAPNPNGFPLFNRNMHVANGSTASNSYGTPGGMLTFIHP